MHQEELSGFLPLILMGLPRSGKSVVGKKLAEEIDVPHYDIDAIIEQKWDKDRRSIFLELGETGYREEELLALQSLSWDEPSVVSLGGGTLTHPSSLSFLENKGLFVYLKWRAESWRQQAIQLNLLHDPDELLRSRVPVYERLAHYTIDVG